MDPDANARGGDRPELRQPWPAGADAMSPLGPRPEVTDGPDLEAVGDPDSIAAAMEAVNARARTASGRGEPRAVPRGRPQALR